MSRAAALATAVTIQSRETHSPLTREWFDRSFRQGLLGDRVGQTGMSDSVLVTGCDTAFGRTAAVYLATLGFDVFAGLSDSGQGPELEAAAARGGASCRPLALDVTDSASVEAAVNAMTNEVGSPYAVVHAAGLVVRGYFEDLSQREIEAIFDANVFGVMRVTRTVLPHMRTAGRGRIVVVSSIAGRIGAPSGCAYAASRFAQEGFAESLSQEVGPFGLQVVLVEPGITRTEQCITDLGWTAGAGDPDAPYAASSRRAEELFNDAVAASNLSATDVAKAVGRALTARRPRMRYVVGKKARLVIALRRLMPEPLFERLYFGKVVRRVSGLR